MTIKEIENKKNWTFIKSVNGWDIYKVNEINGWTPLAPYRVYDGSKDGICYRTLAWAEKFAINN